MNCQINWAATQRCARRGALLPGGRVMGLVVFPGVTAWSVVTASDNTTEDLFSTLAVIVFGLF